MRVGLDAAAIDRSAKEEGDQKARLTLLAPADGTIAELGAEPGNLYDKNDVLMVIDPRSANETAKP